VYHMIGRWFGAGGTKAASRLALAWTQIPYILCGLVLVPLQCLYRDEFFPKLDFKDLDSLRTVATMEHTTAFQAINASSYILGAVCFVWSLFLLAEALQCSAWKAFAVKMTALLLHIPIFMLAAIPAAIIAVGMAMMMA
jgi:hypothetical protein